MIKFIQIENGLAIIKWENLDDSVELKKFMDNCEVTMHYQNLSNPFEIKEGDVE